MFTSYDKAIVALIMAIVFMVNNLTDFHFAVTEDQANAVAGLISPLLVFFIPNKPNPGTKVVPTGRTS